MLLGGIDRLEAATDFSCCDICKHLRPTTISLSTKRRIHAARSCPAWALFLWPLYYVTTCRPTSGLCHAQRCLNPQIRLGTRIELSIRAAFRNLADWNTFRQTETATRVNDISLLVLLRKVEELYLGEVLYHMSDHDDVAQAVQALLALRYSYS